MSIYLFYFKTKYCCLYCIGNVTLMVTPCSVAFISRTCHSKHLLFSCRNVSVPDIEGERGLVFYDYCFEQLVVFLICLILACYQQV